MLTDIPYSKLKSDQRAYEIMRLRDQCGNSYSYIADVIGLSVPRIREIYCKMKFRQIRLYANHIAFVLGHANVSKIMKEVSDAHEFYWDETYVCAYLEKTYHDILTEYRQGEPGLPRQFTKTLPPFRKRLSKKTIQKVVMMRETERASFPEIARKCRLTTAKAKRVYEMFYHEKTLALIQELQKGVESREEKEQVWRACFHGNLPAKERYEMIQRDIVPPMPRSPDE